MLSVFQKKTFEFFIRFGIGLQSLFLNEIRDQRKQKMNKLLEPDDLKLVVLVVIIMKSFC